MNNIIEGAIGNLVGGLLIAVIFFFLKEKIFRFKDVSGCWRVTNETLKTAYNPYRGMKLVYSTILFRSGNDVYGSFEKIYEVAGGNRKEYTGSGRSRGSIEGAYEKNIFSNDRLLLHIIEDGAERTSSTYVCIVVNNENSMEGVFETFAADSSGNVIWERVK